MSKKNENKPSQVRVDEAALYIAIEAIRQWEARGRKPKRPQVTTVNKPAATKRKKKP
jgi:hypothetical protein